MSAPPAAAKSPPGRIWYAVGIALIAATLAAAGYYILHQVTAIADRLIQVVVPGQATLTLNESGTYTIFHEYRSVVDGKIYAAGGLSGLRVTVTSPGGTDVPLTRPGATSRYTLSSRAGVSVFAFEAPAPGAYRLTAAYEDGRSAPRTVLTVGSGFVATIFETVLVTLLIVFAGFGAAVAIIIFVATARRRAAQATPSPPRP